MVVEIKNIITYDNLPEGLCGHLYDDGNNEEDRHDEHAPTTSDTIGNEGSHYRANDSASGWDSTS